MLYYGLLNIGSNEFGPVNEFEFLFCIVTLIVSAIANAVIFGDVASLVANFSESENARQQRLDVANRIMNGIKLPLHDQNEIREFLLKT
jgi:hypothetical protein